MTANWMCKTGGVEHGPYTSEQLAMLVRERRVSALDFVREGAAGSWLPASQLGWLTFPAAPASPAPPPPGPPVVVRQFGAKAVWPWMLVGLAFVAALGVCSLVVVLIAASAAKPITTDAEDPAVEAPQPFNASPASWPSSDALQPPTAVARIKVEGSDATSELQLLVAQLPEEKRALLGLAALFSEADVYAAEIQITNTGNAPVRVFPQNLAVRYGDEAARVTTIDHPRFLQASVLQPGEYIRGLVMYEARTDIGAAMRLGAGGISYYDDTIQVYYGP